MRRPPGRAGTEPPAKSGDRPALGGHLCSAEVGMPHLIALARYRSLGGLALLLLAASGGVLLLRAAGAAGSPFDGGCRPHWQVLSIRDGAQPVAGAGSLQALAATGPDDGWAVGQVSTWGLIAHWDGTDWQRVPAAPLAAPHHFAGVAAAGPADVWVVGSQTGPTGTGDTREAPLIEHWDGRAWHLVPGPDPGQPHAVLNAVAVLGPDNAWAVGASGPDPDVFGRGNEEDATTRPLIWHWTGQRWEPVAAGPQAHAVTILHAVTALAPDDVWAVGETGDLRDGHAGPQLDPQSLVLHWDGQAWHPQIGTSGVLAQVAAAGSRDVWAVGSDFSSPPLLITPLLVHAAGQHWQAVAPPRPPRPEPATADQWDPGGGLTSVTGRGPADVWVTGDRLDSTNYGRPFLAHWTGRGWQVATPWAGELAGAVFHTVLETQTQQVWVGGSRTYQGPPLIARATGGCAGGPALPGPPGP